MQDVESNATKKEHHANTYYISKHPNSIGLAIYIPDRKTAVVGKEQDVKAAMDRGGKADPRPELDFVDTNQHMLFIFAPKDRSAFSSSKSSPFSGSSESMTKFEDLAEDHLKFFCIGLTFHEGIDVQIQGSFTDAESAKKIKTVLDELVEDGRAKLSEAKQDAPSQLTELLSVGETILQSTSTQQNDTTLSMTVTIPDNVKSAFENLQQALPAMIAGAGSLGGMGFGSPPLTRRNQEANRSGESSTGTPGLPFFRNQPEEIKNIKRVWLVEFQIGGYSGEGNMKAAARQALRTIPNVPEASVSLLPGQDKIRCVVRGNSVNTGPMKAALEQAGFKIGPTTVR